MAELPTQVPFAIFERVEGKTHATKQVYEGQGCNNQIEPLKQNKICNVTQTYFILFSCNTCFLKVGEFLMT